MLDFQIFISNLSGTHSMIPIILIICAVLYLNHKQKDALKVFISSTTAMVVTYTLKYISDVPRPIDMLVPETGSRFPSGHATLAAVVMSLGIYYTYHHIHNPIIRYTLYILSVLWFVMVSYSRLYLGVHYPIDIIAGGLIGILATITTIKVFKHVHYYN